MTSLKYTAAVALAAAVGGLHASEDAAPTQPSATPTIDSSAATADRRVVRDKDTGRLRAPSADELREMIDAERASRAAPAQRVVVQRHANGMRSAVLTDEYMVTLTAQRRADGKLAVSHNGNAPATPAPAARLEKE